ncbi:MAG: DUF971 domain-containing protein [Myxococcota bacterium]
MMTPVEIRAPRGARLLEVVWEDGTSSLISHQVLRGYCPCAVCQGHSGSIRWVEGTETLPDGTFELVELRPSGQYALQMTWGDGHSTGIYTFSFLNELGGLFDLSAEESREKTFGR